MNTKNLRGECQHCGGVMQFQAEATGTTAECPHCGQPTELMLALPPDTDSPAKTKAIIFTMIAVVILLAGLVAVLAALKRAERLSARQQKAAANASVASASQSADPFAAAGFRVSPVALDKGQGALVYAVGTLTNTTDRQRFGVRVELELFDEAGKKVGEAKDYQAVMEPKAEWRFRALVLEKKAVSARVVAVKEDR